MTPPITTDQYLQELNSWHNAPYVVGKRCKHSGVDCVNFVVAMLDFLDQKKREECTPLIELPQLLGYADSVSAIREIKTIVNNYEHTLVNPRNLDPDDLKPGDALALNDGVDPVHMAIVGPQAATMWHSCSSRTVRGQFGVRCVSISTALRSGIYRIWRLDSVTMEFEDVI